MHPDERAADVHARCSFDFLNEHRVVKGAPAVGSPAAARVGLRDGRHDLIAVGPGDRALDDDSAVQVLAALGSKVDALLLQGRQHTRQHGGGSLHAGILSDMSTHDLAAGAADHEDIPSFQVRGFQQFFSSLPGLCGKFCVIHEKAPFGTIIAGVSITKKPSPSGEGGPKAG